MYWCRARIYNCAMKFDVSDSMETTQELFTQKIMLSMLTLMSMLVKRFQQSVKIEMILPTIQEKEDVTVNKI